MRRVPAPPSGIVKPLSQAAEFECHEMNRQQITNLLTLLLLHVSCQESEEFVGRLTSCTEIISLDLDTVCLCLDGQWENSTHPATNKTKHLEPLLSWNNE